VPSLRGVLAYWLRALAGSYVGNNLPDLARADAEVFGAASGTNGHPSRILIRAAEPVTYRSDTPGWTTNKVRYLLGPGLYDPEASTLRRAYLPDGADIKLRVKNTGGSEHATLFLAALWALQTFGGLGARARRGFGTITIVDPPGLADAPWLGTGNIELLDQVRQAVADALENLGIPNSAGPERPRYPYFDSAGTWWITGDTTDFGTSLADALDRTGDWLRNFRTGDAANTPEYRTIVERYLTSGQAGPEPFDAGALGLPVPYSNGKIGRAAIIEPVRSPATTAAPPPTPSPQPPPSTSASPRPWSPLNMPTRRPARPGPRPTRDETVADGAATGEETIRRASPLWLRVCRDGPDWQLRSLAFLAEWLPPDVNLRIRDTTPADWGGVTTDTQSVQRPTEQAVDQLIRDWFPTPPE
jgi:CRISPR type III-B/RAMP module RAMP protein Cmr1